MFTLVRDAVVHAPEPLGRLDVAIAAGRIAAIGEHLAPLPDWADARVIDAGGRLLVPGLIDLHLHMIGGGGELGFRSRTPEATLTTLSLAGVTTAVGVLGTDGRARHLSSLLAKARGLDEDGVSTFIYTGAYDVPSPTLTGSIRDDLMSIDKVVGVKVAISDHRSAQPTRSELARLAAEARVGGMLAGKPGCVHVHVGAGSGGLEPLRAVVEKTDVPIGQFVPTHLLRSHELFEQALEWIEAGGNADFTAGSARGRRRQAEREDAPTPAGALRAVADAGLDTSRVTWSSDGQGSLPRFDARGSPTGLAVASPGALLDEVRAAVLDDGMALATALAPVTCNPAARLGVAERKGRVAVGQDADLLLLDPDTLALDTVWARGVALVEGGRAVRFGLFEQAGEGDA
jgi:beta-aspartyl-dipeptidase (metallo-type)